MKKMGLFLVLSFLLCIVADANLLSNPSFEQGGTSWFFSNAAAGFESWCARRTGSSGMIFRGWWDTALYSPAYVSQTVSVSGPGTYTFSIWGIKEANYTATSTTVRIEWLDASDTEIQADTVADVTEFAGDYRWHRMHVTGLCSSSALAKIRVVVAAGWGTPSGASSSFMMDDAELVAGQPDAKLSNPSFELGTDWQNFHWAARPELTGGGTGGARTESWGGWPRSGSNVLALYSWDSLVPTYTTTLWQTVYPTNTLGQYTFTMWIRAEPQFKMSNAQMRIEWYDGSYTNKVADDTITNITVPSDDIYHEYYITGACTSPAMREARPTIYCVWGFNPADGNKSLGMDSGRFLAGPYQRSVLLDWAYHSAPGYKASRESVPGTNVGSFVQVDYGSTSITFYVLAQDPTWARYYPDEDGKWEVRTAWERPYVPGNWIIDWVQMSKVGTIAYSTSTLTLHGMPTNDSVVTMGLYKGSLPLPSTNGVPYTNQLNFYYAPFFKATNVEWGGETDYSYLVMQNGSLTNNVGQLLAGDYGDRDYYVNLNYAGSTQLVNGDFETPPSNDFVNAAWNAWGGAWRETWAARSGAYGARVDSWTNGNGGIWQDVRSTGGVYTFSMWARAEQGFNPTNAIDMKLEWYDTAGSLIKVDRRSYLDLPHDGMWHQMFITASCTSSHVYTVRPVFALEYNPATNGIPGVLTFDDAQLYAGSFVGIDQLQNGSFERRTNEYGWRGSVWSTTPEKDDGWKAGARKEWAYRTGGRGFALLSYTNEGAAPAEYETTLTQTLTPGTGTYTFAIYMRQENNFVLSNCQMSIQWYDATFTNKVQADTATNLVVPFPALGRWVRYDLTGSCADPNLHEVRLNVYAKWLVTATDQFDKAFMIDDGRFVRGTLETDLVNRSYAYYNNDASYSPTNELVPGTNVGAFMQIDYASTTTTFYVLTDYPDNAERSDETSDVNFRLYYADPVLGGREIWTNMTFVGTVDVDSGAMFHGVPAVGTKTFKLWKLAWRQPLDTNGVPYTNNILVWHSPQIRTWYEDVITGTSFFARVNGEYTNDLPVAPQQFTPWYVDKDWYYWNTRPGMDLGYTDGIPNWWWQQEFPGPLTNMGAWDNDGDGQNNWDEFAADTRGNDPLSVFSNVAQNARGYAVLSIQAGPPTTNTRRYDIWWRTDLMDEVEEWVPLNLDVPGNADGSPVTLIVTNDLIRGIYRTGAKLP